MRSDTLRVAVLGCGQIADAHLQEIRKIACAELVAVCDREPELAEQAAARFGIPGVFTSLSEMLERAGPDVVHVTTPPHTHHSLVTTLLDAGVHVYVEKPFTVDAAEARELLDLTAARGRYVCVGHDQLFDPIWTECRRMVSDGRLGSVVHVESFQGYDLGGPFGAVLSAEPGHWVHDLPGGLFQNTISHPLYKITDFLTDEQPKLWATWFDRGGHGFPTELRVVLRGEEVTANLVFCSVCRPVQRVVRVFGTRQGIEVDFDAQTIRVYRGATLPGAFGRLQAPWRYSKESLRLLFRNAWRFLRCDIHFFAGMNALFTLFYRSILEKGLPPIPPEEIYRVTAIMDEIFRCCREAGTETEPLSLTPDTSVEPGTRRKDGCVRTGN